MKTMTEPTEKMECKMMDKSMAEPSMMNTSTMASPMMHAMHRRRGIIAAVAIAVAAIAWYLFRPELLFVDKSVNEAFPTAAAGEMSSQVVGKPQARGMFHSAAHDTKGEASIYQLANGKRVLRLTGFETSNGPDVHVLLGKAADASDNDTVKNAGYVDLGSLKGNIGDQNYEIPADVDAAQYNSVTIWCNRFSVNFGTAPLAMN